MSISKKQIAIIVTISTILLLLALTTLSLLYIPINNIPKKDELKNDFNYLPNDKDFSKYYFDNKVEIDTSAGYELVPLQDNWKNPLIQTYTMIYNEYKAPNNTTTMSAVVIKFKRDNIFDFNWKIISRLDNSIYNTSYQETKELVSKNNIVENNPDSNKIRNIPPLTPEEIENNRKLKEKEQQQSQAERDFNNLPTEEKQKQCNEGVEKFKRNLENAKKGDFTNISIPEGYTNQEYIDETQRVIPELETICKELK